MILIYYLCVAVGRHLDIVLNSDGDRELAFLHRHWRRVEMSIVETEESWIINRDVRFWE